MVTRISIAAALGLTILLAGCFDLDDSLFNKKQLSSYTLGTAVISESQREFVELNSQGKKIYGYFVTSNGAHPDIPSFTVMGTRIICNSTGIVLSCSTGPAATFSSLTIRDSA